MAEQLFPKWLDREEYPFTGHYFQSPAGRMHYLDEGQGDPIVMLHGNPGWSFEFRHQVKALSGTYRCIVPDQIGFGLSEKPYAWDYLPEHHAKNFEALMEHLGLEKITIVVNDWGGPVGLSYAIRHPEKIKRIVLLNTWLWSVENDPHFRKFSAMMGGPIGRFLIRNFNIFGKMVVKKAMADGKNLDPAIHRHYYAHLETKNDRKGSWVFPRQIIHSSSWLDQLWQQRQTISTIPVTIVWGMKDIAFREKELQTWLELFPQARLIRLDDAGHYPQEEKPAVVTEALKG